MLGSLILYLRGMRLMMFQLSGSCCKCTTRRILDGKTAARTGVYEDAIRVHQALLGLLGLQQEIWEFPKIGDPNIVP